jgi:hypothetical protein
MQLETHGSAVGGPLLRVIATGFWLLPAVRHFAAFGVGISIGTPPLEGIPAVYQRRQDRRGLGCVVGAGDSKQAAKEKLSLPFWVWLDCLLFDLPLRTWR